MSLSAALWEENRDLAGVALGHRFVRGVGDGTLRLENFQGYVAQDAFFLDSFARAYALSAAHSPDSEGLRDFAELLSGVIEELELHEGYAKRWGVSLAEATPGEATLAYTEFLTATAAARSVGETCAAMTPCMRLYVFLGQSLAREGYSEQNPYSEWIQTYAHPDFEALAVRLEGLLDRYAEEGHGVRFAYRRAMMLEVAFFDANAGSVNGPERA